MPQTHPLEPLGASTTLNSPHPSSPHRNLGRDDRAASTSPLELADALPDTTTASNHLQVRSHAAPAHLLAMTGSPSPAVSSLAPPGTYVLRLEKCRGLAVRCEGMVVNSQKFPGACL
jgi:hypothetical protein